MQALDKHSKLSLALTSKPAIQARPPRSQGKDSLRYQLRTSECCFHVFTRCENERQPTAGKHVKHNWKQEHVLRSRRLFNSLRLHANSINQFTYFTYLPRRPIPQTRGLLDGVSLEK